MRRNARVDANQKKIVEDLRKAGASVQHLHTVGQGCLDLLVGYRKKNFVLEVKEEKGALTSDQIKWIAEWRGSFSVVRTSSDALEAIGATR